MGHDEYERDQLDPKEGLKVSEHGEYLRVQYCEHPVYVYKLVESERNLHPFTACIEHKGAVYGLAWMEDDKEYIQYPPK